MFDQQKLSKSAAIAIVEGLKLILTSQAPYLLMGDTNGSKSSKTNVVFFSEKIALEKWE